MEEWLSVFQRHWEDLNQLETEEMVLDARSDLEDDVREEIRDAQTDLHMWLRRGTLVRLARIPCGEQGSGR